MLTCRCLNIKIHTHRPTRDGATGGGAAGGGQAVSGSDEEDPSSCRGSRAPVRLGVGGLTVEQPALLAIAREPDREPASVSLRCLNCSFAACSFVARPGIGFPETARDLVRRPIPTTLAPLDGLVHVAEGALTAEEVELAKTLRDYSPAFRLVLKGSSLAAETEDDSTPKALRPEYAEARRSISSALSKFLVSDARTTEEDIARYREKMLADLQQRQRVAARQQHFLWKTICDAHAGDVYERSNAKESSRAEATAEKGEAASSASGAAKPPAQRLYAVDNDATTPPPAMPDAELASHPAASTAIWWDVRDKRLSRGLPEEPELALGTGSDPVQLDVQHDKENGHVARAGEGEGERNFDDDNDSAGPETSDLEGESDSDDVPGQSAGSGETGPRHEFARYGRSAPINIVFPRQKPGDTRSSIASSARIQMSFRKQSARSGPAFGRHRLSDSPAGRRRRESGEGRGSSPPLPAADFEAVSSGPPPYRPGDRPRSRPAAAASPFVAPHILAEQEEEEMKHSLFLGSVPRNPRSHY